MPLAALQPLALVLARSANLAMLRLRAVPPARAVAPARTHRLAAVHVHSAHRDRFQPQDQQHALHGVPAPWDLAGVHTDRRRAIANAHHAYMALTFLQKKVPLLASQYRRATQRSVSQCRQQHGVTAVASLALLGMRATVAPMRRHALPDLRQRQGAVYAHSVLLDSMLLEQALAVQPVLQALSRRPAPTLAQNGAHVVLAWD